MTAIDLVEDNIRVAIAAARIGKRVVIEDTDAPSSLVPYESLWVLAQRLREFSAADLTAASGRSPQNTAVALKHWRELGLVELTVPGRKKVWRTKS